MADYKKNKDYYASEEARPMKNGAEFSEHIDIDPCEKYTKPKQPHWIVRRIYILSWIRSYNREMAVADLIAGITLGMTVIPQSIAYAALAGLSSEYGLYTAFIGSIIYVFFGTIPQVSIGPTSLMALLVLQFCADKPVQIVIVLSFLAGLVEFLMGVFQLGFIVNFIPSPVTKSFTSGTATIVALVQVKNLLGIKIKGVPSFSEFWANIRAGDATLGISCLIILLLLRQLSHINFKKQTPTTRTLQKILWYISISRNALVVFTCAAMAYFWIGKDSIDAVPFQLSSRVDEAALSLRLPPFVFEYNNTTYMFTDICREIGSGIIVVPIVAVLANVAIAKAFVKDGKLDASQEMLTLGLCNIAGSFFSAFPTCGAFTRSAVSQASGVRTPMAGIYTGTIVFLALSVLTPYFRYIPKATLGAVLIGAVVFMIDFKPVKELWQSNKKDFFSWIGCFIVCLLAGVQMGLLFGIVLNMIFILLRLGTPKVEVKLKEMDGMHYVHITPCSDIYYTGVDHLRTEICAAAALYRYEFPIVVDCFRFMLFDATFIEMIAAVAKELKEKEVLMILQRMTLKIQEQMPVIDNIRYSDEITSTDLVNKQ